ncbi:TlpA family protein disulfide reductase [Terrimonas sp. NA20]|uniref:TlpA family protein disulfide reductase n=1 Tax=Terrimonas ginsenosidimutans TaxID=2908004 RepID=A0ABS9KLT3_9BACT|nr:TlpA disulfide reductase family protein [Terrimonas ginsenosidimutans]MCG2613276.1 TlpA family protein disulfide reductase [Terrimonas ginsenosidimutans]
MKLSLALLAILFSLSASAQTRSRSQMQTMHFYSAVLKPQLDKGAVRIETSADVDKFFVTLQDSWNLVATDSMKKYPTPLTEQEFRQLDAYIYFWAIASASQDLDIADKIGSHLVRKYMIPAMRSDMATITRLKSIEALSLVHAGTLVNTVNIGSSIHADREAILATWELHKDLTKVFKELTAGSDSLVRNAANRHLRNMQNTFYPLNASAAFYSGNNKEAFLKLSEGLNAERFPGRKAVHLAKQMLTSYGEMNQTEESFALLDTLALHVSPEFLGRDTLRNFYLQIDKNKGPVRYATILKKLPASAFFTSSSSVTLPKKWAFLLNEIPAEKIGKAKYFLFDFWYTACGPCIKEIPELNEFYTKLLKRDDIILISINTDAANGHNDESYVTDKSKQYKISFPVVYDRAASSLAEQLKVQGYPQKFILDKQGRLVNKLDAQSHTLESFELLLKEQDAKVN